MKSKKIIVLIVSLVIIFLIVTLLYIILYNNNRIMSNNTPIESSKFNSQTDNQVHDTNKNMTIVDISQSNNSTNTVVNLNDKRDLTTIEIAEVKKFLNDKNNSNFLDIALDFKSYEDVNFEDIILFANIAFTKEYTSEEIEKMYISEGGVLAGGEIINATVSNVQKIYKEKFNVEVSKEAIKNMAQNNSRPIYYNSQNDLLMFIPDGAADGGLCALSDEFSGIVQNNKYIINLEYELTYKDDIMIKTLTLVKIENEFYFESLLTNGGEKLDINSELVKELYYGYVPNTSGIWGHVGGEWNSEDYSSNVKSYRDAYRSKKVTINDIDNKVVLCNGFRNKSKLLVQGENAFLDPTASSPTDSILNPSGEGPWYYFTLELMEQTVKRIYGKDATITHEEFDCLSGVASCSIGKYNNVDMYHYSFGGGGAPYYETNVQELVSAVKVNDEIYLYDRNLYLVEDVADGNNEESGYNLDFYDCCERNNLVKRLFLSYDEYTLDTRENSIESVKDLMILYKHTFKQAEDGSYYWYSTEPLE